MGNRVEMTGHRMYLEVCDMMAVESLTHGGSKWVRAEMKEVPGQPTLGRWAQWASQHFDFRRQLLHYTAPERRPWSTSWFKSYASYDDGMAKASQGHLERGPSGLDTLEENIPVRFPSSSLSKAFAFSNKPRTLLLQFEFLDFPARRLGIVVYPEHILGH